MAARIIVSGAAAAFVLASLGSQARAQEGEPQFIALGAGWNPEYVGADEYDIIPFGAFRIQTGVADIQSSGLSVFADVLAPYQRDQDLRISFGPQVNYRFGRDEDISREAVKRLGPIDDAVEVGLIAGVETDRLAVRAEALRDVSDVYEGWTYGLEATYTFNTPPQWGANLVVNTQYGDDAFHNRYFDVSPAQAAASGFDAYDAEQGFYQVAIGTNLRRSLSRRTFVAGQFVYARLIGDVADSPIVRDGGSEGQFRGGLTFGFTF